MLKSDFNYHLPQELIAQQPIEKRDHSRMMLINRRTGEIAHRHFYDLTDYLKKGDCLILNDSKVLPARLLGQRADTGSDIELLLLNQREELVWEVIAGPGKKAKPGKHLTFGNGRLTCEVLEVLEGGNRIVRFELDDPSQFYPVLYEVGQMPLPHYITEELKDKDRYQTVYSRELGSAAAPTAGLHFTTEMLQKISDMGVGIGYVTLHVGLGTFRPVKADNILDHKMHSEHYELPTETAELINSTKASGGRVISVGTTSTRTLESVATRLGRIEACSGWTDIFIYPGYEFKCIDGLITNFHLPESTLIMLVSAFLGREKTLNAYKTAVEERYRFYSLGDAMFII
ncbi:MAG: tRNA preQ1(34) S-adenosylmethionine ribosyltransferase-isomerase QueA [Clostridia bacterium]|nr:tRNA preQ1(34) S-adenosylmethionine ribosyltransferase-isomerase QueA [Clostridia bacterium]